MNKAFLEQHLSGARSDQRAEHLAGEGIESNRDESCWEQQFVSQLELHSKCLEQVWSLHSDGVFI